MAKGISGGGDDGGGNVSGSGGAASQAQKMSQVFLRNLPLAMLEPDIETMLGDCGPIKRIDLIKTTNADTGAKLSRGFGFVTFALEADAAKAVNTVHGKRVMGREVSCEIALKKGSKREVKGRDQGGPAAPRPNQTTNTSGRAGGGEGVASSYGGGGGASGRKAPVTTSTPTAGSGELSQAAASASKDTAVEDAGEQRIKGAGKKSAKAVVVEGEKPAAEKRPAGAEAGDGLSKKDARKLARKVMKKERKAKAKERAKEKKEAQAKEEAAAVKVEVSAGGADPNAGGKGDEAEGEADAEEPVDPKAAKLMADARTLLVFGVADGLTAKQLQKRVKKFGTVTALSVEENERKYFPLGKIARVVCASKEGTRKIITGIDGHTVHGQTLRARRLMEIVPGHDVRQQKQQRLIVRNLNFHAKEENLADAFSAFGPLAEVHIPTVRVTSQKRIRGTDDQETVTEDRSRGFGFVQFLCPRDAARVVKDHGVLNICGRDAAVDYSVTKEKFNALKQGGADATATNGDDDDASTPPLDGSAEASGSEDEMDVDDDPEGEHTKGGDETSDDESEDDEEDEDEEGGPDAGAGVGRAQERQRTADVQQGCTIFVRNVAFDCRQEEVKDRFGEFGAVRLALLVTDRATGMPRGSAFVKFSNKDEADRCLAAAIGATDPTLARDSGGSCIYLGTRALHVTRAVDREQAGRLTVGAQKRVSHKDKRNLYLSDEGLVIEDSGAAEGTAKSDMEKRVQTRRDKKSKLKNPIFFVSPVRLSVRNLARHVTDGKLKAMAAAAARAGIDACRATPQDVRLYLEAQGEEFAAITPKRLQIPAVTAASVVKSKIIRDMDKKPSTADPSELHPSKGYGFVEFSHHGQALAALRHMNNNPAFSGQAKSDGVAKGETSRLMVEFSVENHAKLKLQQGRKEAFEQRKRELKALGLGQDGRPMPKKDDKEKKSRGKVQREKKKRDAESANSDTVDTTGQAPPNANATAAAPHKKRKKPGANREAEGVGARSRGGQDDAAANVDDETDGLVGDQGAEGGEDRPKRKKNKKKASKYEQVDSQERAYQKLETAYTAKAELAAGSKAAGSKAARGSKGKGKRAAAAAPDSGAAAGADSGGRKKEKAGRWFD